MVNGNGVHIDPTGASGAGSNQALLVDNISIDTNTIASTNTNGNIVLAPNGTGDVQLDADTVRVGDSGLMLQLLLMVQGPCVEYQRRHGQWFNHSRRRCEQRHSPYPKRTGKVGVGQATPTAKLHVNGDATISGT